MSPRVLLTLVCEKGHRLGDLLATDSGLVLDTTHIMALNVDPNNPDALIHDRSYPGPRWALPGPDEISGVSPACPACDKDFKVSNLELRQWLDRKRKRVVLIPTGKRW